jgi:hypothetical protein
VTAVFHRVVRLVRRDTVGGDQRAVEDQDEKRSVRLPDGFD